MFCVRIAQIFRCRGLPGSRLLYFALPKIQVTKQKGTLPRRPYGLPSV
jgi:hypothetical protein